MAHDVIWHLFDFVVVSTNELRHIAGLGLRHQIYHDALAALTTATPNAVNILLALARQLVVNATAAAAVYLISRT